MIYPQIATIWTPGVKDAFGKPTWSAPETLEVRWEDRSVLFVDGEGRQVKSSAVVYVQKEVPIGVQIARGLSVSLTPTAGSFEVKDYREITSLRGDRTERRLML